MNFTTNQQSSAALPIERHREEILRAVKDHEVVIIQGEPGCGKTTRVPQYLLQAGYQVLVTEPRSLAARAAAARCASELGVQIGGIVGVYTGAQQAMSSETRCLFATDSMALPVLEAYQQPLVVVIDEVHEYTVFTEAVIAYTNALRLKGRDIRVVIMSATIDAESISSYFGGAPIIEVMGRVYPVIQIDPGVSMEEDAIRLLSERRNVLVFQPTVADIEGFIADIRASNVNAEILPLHGQLPLEEQNLCFKSYSRPLCVVATSVAQASITIPCIDAVIDSGLERRQEYRNGVSSLVVRPISQACAKQRKGRAGRTRPGIYINHYWKSQPEFPTPEIQRTALELVVLRLAAVGIRAEELDFMHQPSQDQMQEACRMLVALRCLNAHGNFMEKGANVIEMNISVRAACMMLEAKRLGVIDDGAIIAAIMDCGGIVRRKDSNGDFVWSKLQRLTSETSSDLLAQLALFKCVVELDTKQRRELDMLDFRKFRQVCQTVDRLSRRFQDCERATIEPQEMRKRLVQTICAGMVDCLWKRDLFGFYHNIRIGSAQCDRHSVVSPDAWCVGLPLNIEVRGRIFSRTISIVHTITEVDPKMLEALAPHLVVLQSGNNPMYDEERDVCRATTLVVLDGQIIRSCVADEPNHPAAAKLKAAYLQEQQREADKLLVPQLHQQVIELRNELLALTREKFMNEVDDSKRRQVGAFLLDVKQIEHSSASMEASDVRALLERGQQLKAMLEAARANYEARRQPEQPRSVTENPATIDTLRQRFGR